MKKYESFEALKARNQEIESLLEEEMTDEQAEALDEELVENIYPFLTSGRILATFTEPLISHVTDFTTKDNAVIECIPLPSSIAEKVINLVSKEFVFSPCLPNSFKISDGDTLFIPKTYDREAVCLLWSVDQESPPLTLGEKILQVIEQYNMDGKEWDITTLEQLEQAWYDYAYDVYSGEAEEFEAALPIEEVTEAELQEEVAVSD